MRKVSIIKAVTIAIVAVGLGACGSTGATEATDGPAAGSGSLDGKGKSLVAFMFSSADAYYGAEIPALKAEAKRLNYDLKVFENNFDQGEMDQQVQQWLATGEEPEAILYLPATADASVNSARLLSQRAPVIAFGGEVPEAAATRSGLCRYQPCRRRAVGRIPCPPVHQGTDRCWEDFQRKRRQTQHSGNKVPVGKLGRNQPGQGLQ